MNSYFVAALPRSRTAWLSVFLSQSGRHCYHEAINGCPSISEYQIKIKGCGDSSTGLTVIDIQKLYPESKILIIDKSDEELEKCIAWCDKTYSMDSRAFILEQHEKLSKLNGLRISQSDINNRLKDIWGYLIGTQWNDSYKRLLELNIQVQSTDIDKKAALALHASIQQNTQ